jgi:hypothetical protein
MILILEIGEKENKKQEFNKWKKRNRNLKMISGG